MPKTAEDFRDDILNVGAWSALSQLLRHVVVDILLTVGELRRISEKGTWLQEASHTENYGYVLLEGRVSVERAEHGQLEVVSPSLIGEMMQFNPTELRTATVSTITSCLVLRFTWEDFWQKMAERLNDQDCGAVRNALESVSWARFTELD